MRSIEVYIIRRGMSILQSMDNKEGYEEYRSVCNMGDLSDRDPYVSLVWNTDATSWPNSYKKVRREIPFSSEIIFKYFF